MAYNNSHNYGGYNSGPPGRPGQPGQPGGFAAGGTQQRMPHGADPQLWNWFSAVDFDRSGAVSATELQQALVNGDWSPFDLDTVKLLMSIFDADRSGTIGFNEFVGLWQYIKDWQNVFRHFDADHSGSIEGPELANALRQFGYNLSPQIIQLVTSKYGAIPRPRQHGQAHGGAGGFSQIEGGSSGITFDRFVRACVVVKTLSEAFQRFDTDRDGWIQINYDQFMQTVLSLP